MVFSRPLAPILLRPTPAAPHQRSLLHCPSTRLQGIVVFVIDGDQWTLDLREGQGKLTQGAPPDGDKVGWAGLGEGGGLSCEREAATSEWRAVGRQEGKAGQVSVLNGDWWRTS